MRSGTGAPYHTVAPYSRQLRRVLRPTRILRTAQHPGKMCAWWACACLLPAYWNDVHLVRTFQHADRILRTCQHAIMHAHERRSRGWQQATSPSRERRQVTSPSRERKLFTSPSERSWMAAPSSTARVLPSDPRLSFSPLSLSLSRLSRSRSPDDGDRRRWRKSLKKQPHIQGIGPL